MVPESVVGPDGRMVSPVGNLAGLDLHTATGVVASVESLGDVCAAAHGPVFLPAVRMAIAADGGTAG